MTNKFRVIRTVIDEVLVFALNGERAVEYAQKEAINWKQKSTSYAAQEIKI